MKEPQLVPAIRMFLMFVPVSLVIVIMARWKLSVVEPSVAVGRMLLQLLLIGFVLTFIFQAETPWIVLLVCMIMILVAGWISLRSLHRRSRIQYQRAVLGIFLGGGVSLLMVTQGVLELDPWFSPRQFVPLAGMVFANAMNAVSLAAERFQAESQRGEAYESARNTALRASLIPITNSFLAVGLVSIPGMMTGQVLAGINPLTAATYQIVIMCMVYASAGIATIVYLWQQRGGGEIGSG